MSAYRWSDLWEMDPAFTESRPGATIDVEAAIDAARASGYWRGREDAGRAVETSTPEAGPQAALFHELAAVARGASECRCGPNGTCGFCLNGGLGGNA